MNNSHVTHLISNKNIKFFVKKKRINIERLQCPGFRRLLERKRVECFPLRFQGGLHRDLVIFLSFQVNFDTINHLISRSVCIMI